MTPRDSEPRFPRARRSAALLLLLLCLAPVPACSNLDRLLEEAEQGDVDDRRDKLSELELEVRRLRGEEPNIQEARAKIDNFLKTRFTIERDAINRSTIIALALQGEYPCAPSLVLEGARDPSLMVRQQAVLGMREAPPPEARTVLTDLLKNDRSTMVRIEVAKVFRTLGDATWVDPLVGVLVDETEDGSLRWQCHASANHIIGQQLPFTADAWNQWRLAQSPVVPPEDPGASEPDSP